MPTNEGHSQKWEIDAPYGEPSRIHLQSYRLLVSADILFVDLEKEGWMG